MKNLHTFSLAVAAVIGADRVLAQFGIEDTGDEEQMAQVQAALSLQHEANEVIESLQALYDEAEKKATLQVGRAALAQQAAQVQAMYGPASTAVLALKVEAIDDAVEVAEATRTKLEEAMADLDALKAAVDPAVILAPIEDQNRTLLNEIAKISAQRHLYQRS